jgi:hypothetical protein
MTRNFGFRPVGQCVVVAIVSFMAGAALFAHAQTGDEQKAIERAQTSMRRGGFDPRFRNDVAVVSPDGNSVVFDLGDTEVYGSKARSHAVYDFQSKKVFMVRLVPSSNAIRVDSESLR